MQPVRRPGRFVFVTQAAGVYGAGTHLNPIAAVQESEGLTLVVPQELADRHHEEYEGVFSMISLEVHSSLHAVGLTARIATAFAERNISANVVAGHYHDHVFVPYENSEDALKVLLALTRE